MSKKKREISVLGYKDNWGGRTAKPQPLVHVLLDGDYTGQDEHISFCLKPKQVLRLACAMLDAADYVRDGDDYEDHWKVKFPGKIGTLDDD